MNLSAETFIRERLVLTPLPFRPDIALYRPTPKSGLIGWLAEQDRTDTPPYWAYAWAGGAALALYLAQHQEVVAGKSVLDFGAGGGLVAIAAAKVGARVTAFEPDPIGQAAIKLNAEANGVEVGVSQTLVETEIVLAGDVFYNAEVAARTLPTLLDIAATGAAVLVGDPFRRDLPLRHLRLIAEFAVPDFGGDRLVRSGVFCLEDDPVSDQRGPRVSPRAVTWVGQPPGKQQTRAALGLDPRANLPGQRSRPPCPNCKAALYLPLARTTSPSSGSRAGRPDYRSLICVPQKIEFATPSALKSSAS